MRSTCPLAILLVGLAGTAVSAQQVPFERTFDVPPDVTLDVTTIRGKIAVTAGEQARVEVRGTVTVRFGFNVPVNAPEIAKRLAANPPVSRDGNVIRLRPPATGEERRAVTVSYEVRVPRTSRVKSSSGSGATSISGVGGSVEAETQSGAVDLEALGGAVDVTSQSGSIRASDVAGRMSVRTGSSAISLRGLGSGLQARTQSGAVDAAFRGHGDVDVETSSSSVELVDVNGALRARTSSGRVRASGAPSAPWRIDTGSGAVEIGVAHDAGFALDATSGSGQVRVEGLSVSGSQAKGLARGTVGSGGPLVHVTSRSGSIDLRAR